MKEAQLGSENDETRNECYDSNQIITASKI